jgi:hypothetical protein
VPVVAKALTTSPREIAAALRQRALRLKPEEIGLKERSYESSPAVWGVVIDTAYPDAVATLVALSDGSVSFYVSNGTGCIGCGNQREVRQESADLLALAAGALPLTIATDDTELPPPGTIRFYLFARDGLHCTQTPLEYINRADERLGRLYFCGQRVLATIERVGAGQSLAHEIQIVLSSIDGKSSGVQDYPQDDEPGDPLCLSVGNVVRRLRT